MTVGPKEEPLQQPIPVPSASTPPSSRARQVQKTAQKALHSDSVSPGTPAHTFKRGSAGSPDSLKGSPSGAPGTPADSPDSLKGSPSVGDIVQALKGGTFSRSPAAIKSGLGQLEEYCKATLRLLDREQLFFDLDFWERSFSSEPDLKGLFVKTLETLLKNQSIDIGLRKGAQNVLAARLQGKLIDAMNADKFLEIVDLATEARTLGIPLHKLVKDYNVTTGSSRSLDEREDLHDALLQCQLKSAIDANSKLQILEILKEWHLLHRGDMVALNEVISLNQLPEELSKFFIEADKVTRVLGANRGQITVDNPEVLNFALQLHQLRGGARNEKTNELQTTVLKKVGQQGFTLANDMYKALIEQNHNEVRRILQEVQRSHFGPQFHLFLEMVQSAKPTTERQQIVSRVIEIYGAMSALPITDHRMSPYELVKCALVAERELFAADRLASAVVQRGEGVRTRIVDHTQREITFLGKSKELGGLYEFGTFKKVSSAITVRLVWENNRPTFRAQPTITALMKGSNLRPESLEGWKDEVAAFGEYRGITGLLSFQTVADYTRNVDGVIHPKQVLVMKQYDLGSFWDFKKMNPPAAVWIGYYREAALGLQNMHHFRDENTNEEVPRVHGDIKPGNLLASRDGSAALADYGFQSIPKRGENMPLNAPYYGTPGYSDPEVSLAVALAAKAKMSHGDYLRTKYDQRVFDCFAMGISMLESIDKYPKSMQKQSDLYKKKAMDDAAAITVQTDFKKEYETARANLENKPNRDPIEEFEWIAWQMANPTIANRMTADQYVTAMHKLPF